MYPLSEDGIGEELTAINLIPRSIQEEKMATKLLIMIVMEYLDLTQKGNLMNKPYALNLKELVLQL